MASAASRRAMNSANTMPTPAMPANRALGVDEQRMKRSGCDGPPGWARTPCAGWLVGNASRPAASSSQAFSSANQVGKASDPAERKAAPVRVSPPRARPTPRSMRPGARASSAMNCSTTFSGL